MLCASCGFTNHGTYNFCGNCGTEISTECPSCKLKVPLGFNFCGYCGTKVNPDAKPKDSKEKIVVSEEYVEDLVSTQHKVENEAEIRNVTVLFTDVSGFTAMSENLDPEEVREIMNGCFEKLTQIIFQYEGTVDKFIGDAVMALFGAPIAHENDPERAVRAAIDMQAALNEFSADLKVRLGFGLKMRVGINTGSVVAGSVGSDLRSDYTVMGDTVNLASRLEHNAPIGSILISQSTYKHVSQLFEFTKMEPLQVKGKVKPVDTYMVSGLAEENKQTSQTNAPMIARNRELNLLVRLSDNTRLLKKSSVAVIFGEAGIGKDRLLIEFERKLNLADTKLLSGRTVTYARSGSYWIYVDMLKGYFDLKDSDTDAAASKKIVDATKSFLSKDEASDVLPYIGYLLSNQKIIKQYSNKLKFLDPNQLKDQIFFAVRKFLTNLSETKPLVINLNDFHASDDLSIELTDYIIDGITDKRIQICISLRPNDRASIEEFIEKTQKNKTIDFARINLEKLPKKYGAKFLQYICKDLELPPLVSDLILEKSDGVPFFIEEISKMFFELGYLEMVGGRLKIETLDLQTLEIPGTLHGLMMSRFDLLGQREKLTAQLASVIGRSYRERLLIDVKHGEISEKEIETALKELEAVEVIQLDKVAADNEYSFKSAVMHETIYNSILKKKRTQFHELIGSYYEKKYAKRTAEYLEVLAHHFSHSNDLEKAFKYLTLAGNKAKEQYANSQALNYYEQALKACHGLTADLAEEQVELHISMADIFSLTGEYDQAAAHYDFALKLLKAGGEPQKLALINQLKGNLFSYTNEFDKAFKFLDKALHIIQNVSGEESRILKARIYDSYGWIYYNQGKYEEAAEAGREALVLVEKTDSFGDISKAYNLLGAIDYDAGNWDSALEYFSNAKNICDKINYFRGISACLNNIATIQFNRGLFEESLSNKKESYNIAEKIGDKLGVVVQLGNMGNVYCALGKYQVARKHLDKALEWAIDIAPPDYVAEINCYYAQMLIGIEEYKRAQELINETLGMLKDIDSPYYYGLALKTKAELMEKLADNNAAVELYKEALDIFKESESLYEIGVACQKLGDLFEKIDSNKYNKEISKLTDEYQSIYRTLGIAL